MRLHLLLAFAAATACAEVAAQGEHERRLGAELAVMAGDLRRLEEAAVPALQREGLRDRLAGALASLPLLLRRGGSDTSAVPFLRAALAKRDWRSLRAGLDDLRRRNPFEPGALLPRAPSPERLRLGQAIHLQACAGCHDAPAAQTRFPALNLFEQAKGMPRDEFAARLLMGVRGDRSTAWRNPFSDSDLSALIAFYYAGEP